MQEQDIQLAARCARLAEQSRHAATWLADNRETVGSECTTLQKEMRRAARFFGKCEQAARRKMCVGVFGPSQSGKSYLISALARDSRGDLLADFCGRTSDFITEINPEGGKESTGLVTRFTTTPPQGLTPDFPIRLRLLSEMDVVRVLANTYYADCEHKQMPDADAMRSALERLTQTARQSSPGASSVTADDVEDLREYLNRSFLSKPRVQMLQQGYWAQAVSLAPLLPLSYRAELFGIIWNNQPKFQQLFLELCQALEALGNPAEADCPLEALLPRQTSIIDVALLAGLGTNSAEDRLTLLGKDGRKAALPRAVVTALTAEITIFMREQPDDFFSYTDLLDFPGYRSRLKILDLDKELEREGALQNLFLRGKVAYLFERYCEEHELTSMLLCIGPGNQEVQDLPRAVYDWICSTHGENPAHRAGKAPSLFFVLTKMDMEFEKKAGSPSVEQRWNTRLQSSLLDFFGKQHDWPTNWDGAHPFRNIFLLRNPNFRCEAIFTFDAQGNESGVRPDQIAYVEEVRRAFVDSPLVRRHVDDPEAVWQAAMTLNDGGISLLRQRLRPLCNPELKRHQIGVGLDEQAERVLTALGVYYQSDDREELRRQKETLARNLAVLLARVAQSQTFGEMLHRLQVSDHDLYALCAQVTSAMPEAENGGAAPASIGVRVSQQDILDDLFGDEAPVATEMPGSAPVTGKDSAAELAEAVFDAWVEQVRQFAADAETRTFFAMPARELDQFCHELLLSAQRCRVRQQMEEDLRACSAYSNLERERLLWKQASLAADAINAFVDWLGFDPRHHSEQERTIIFRDKPVVLFPAVSDPVGEPLIGEVEAPYDRQWYTDWLRALMHGITANVDFDGQQIRNPQQNKRLYDILQAFKG